MRYDENDPVDKLIMSVAEALCHTVGATDVQAVYDDMKRRYQENIPGLRPLTTKPL